MPVIYDGAFLELRAKSRLPFSHKSSIIYVWKGSKYTSTSVVTSYIVIKNREDIKPYQYQSVQRFFSEHTYVKHISDSYNSHKNKSIWNHIHLPKAYLD